MVLTQQCGGNYAVGAPLPFEGAVEAPLSGAVLQRPLPTVGAVLILC